MEASPYLAPEQRVRPARRLVVAGLAIAMLASIALIMAGAVFAAGTLVGATFSGGAGTASAGGTFYAKSGASLTLTVVTGTTTSCVALSGTHTATSNVPSSSDATSRSWTFAMAAVSGSDGARSTTVTTHANSTCTSAQDSGSASYSVDNTAPVVTGTRSPAPNSYGWNNSPVTITWSASDAGSGVASGPTPSSDSQTADTGSLAKTSTATDRVGNVGNGMVVVKVDKTAPSLSVSRNPPSNANGWSNTEVTVSFTCSDGRSGIRSCSGPTTFSSNGAGQSVTGTALDYADNSSSAAVTVNVDKIAPTVSGAPTGSPNGAGWYNTNVSVVWTCSDTGGSGFAQGTCANSTISSEGTGQTLTRTVTDLAGNTSAPATSSPAVNLDKTAPTTTATPVNNGASVDVTLSATDALSGVAATQFKSDGGPTQTYSAANRPSFSAPGNHTLEYWSVDAAGNVEQHQSLNVSLDGNAPVVTVSQSPVKNANGWNNSNVTVSFSCSDADSGVASCPAPVTVSSEGADQVVSGTAYDNAGNSASASTSVSVDKTAPVVSVTGVTAGESYPVGGYDAGCATTDALSGVASSATLATAGGPTGSVTLTCSGATDKAGNAQAGPVSVTVNVTAADSPNPDPSPDPKGYDFGGFLPPVAGDGAVNEVPPGSSVVVRFRLGGDQGRDVFADGYPMSVAYDCSGSPATEGGDRVWYRGHRELHYNRYTRTYWFVWQTQWSWTGCRALVLKFDDGSTHVALFDFDRHDRGRHRRH